MIPDVPGLEFVVGDAALVEQMREVPALRPFSDEAVGFLDTLSKELFAIGRAFSDVVTFAFWCRRGAVLREAQKYADGAHRLGRGIAFHSTPSNVAVNFAFSFATGLLAGNPNVVRLPAKDFEQVRIISMAVRKVLDAQPQMRPYVVFVKFGLIKEFSDYFSSICASRIVWGGDMTIALMRQSPLPPRAIEVTFADRYSFLVLNAEAVLTENDLSRLVRNFWNDTYFTDQNACTSPRLVVWVGENKAAAQELFWNAVNELVVGEYALQPVQTVQKLSAFYRAAAAKNVKRVGAENNFVYRVKVDCLDKSLMDFKYNSGFFFEYDAPTLAKALDFTTVKCQTLTYFGFSREELSEALCEAVPQGIDRIVPIGASMNFALIWDGYDLIRTLSRVISIV